MEYKKAYDICIVTFMYYSSSGFGEEKIQANKQTTEPRTFTEIVIRFECYI